MPVKQSLERTGGKNSLPPGTDLAQLLKRQAQAESLWLNRCNSRQ